MFVRIAVTILAGVLAILAASTSRATGLDPSPAGYLHSCTAASPQLCKSSRDEFAGAWPKALKGDYQSQRNVAYCLADGCDNAVRVDLGLSCAWRIVVLASGTDQLVSTDNSNLRSACRGRLSDAAVAQSKVQAAQIFEQVYKRALPPPPWEWVVPIGQLLVDRERTSGQLRAAMRLAAQCPGATVDQARVDAILARLGVNRAKGGEFDALAVAAKMERDYPGVATGRSAERGAENCKTLTDLYGRTGIVVPGIANVPLPAHYP